MMQLYRLPWRKPIPFNGKALSWLQAFDECVREGRAYTEIHFYRNPATEELVITYWEID
jgi:hypothetical protein